MTAHRDSLPKIIPMRYGFVTCKGKKFVRIIQFPPFSRPFCPLLVVVWAPQKNYEKFGKLHFCFYLATVL
jgi:hypothetical protein